MGNLTCGFIGLPPACFPFGYDEEDPLCVTIKLTLLNQIMALYLSGVTIYYSGCSFGVDLWVAEIVISLMETRGYEDIELICVIPYEEQAKKWSPPLRERYYTMLEKSTQNIMVSSVYTKGCFENCRRFIIDHSNFMITVYDKQLDTTTKNNQYVLYALQKSSNIIHINPNNAAVTFTIKA